MAEFAGKSGNSRATAAAERDTSWVGTVRGARCIVGKDNGGHKGMERKTNPPLNFQPAPVGM